jgi:hypothetical protein
VLAVERRAWFDLNGDGTIDDASALLGGDGYLVGDGNRDGRVSQQVTYEPIETHSRPVARTAPSAAAPVTAQPAPAENAPARVDAALVRRAEAAYRAITDP